MSTDTNFVEDKTCRICGIVDTCNINIFDKKLKNLLSKITAVFPIIIYESDPLPKNICRRCIECMSFIYDEYQKMSKAQKKWIDNVRTNQPNHPYIQILDMVENIDKETQMRIGKLIPDFVLHKSCIPKNEEFKSTKMNKNITLQSIISSSSSSSSLPFPVSQKEQILDNSRNINTKEICLKSIKTYSKNANCIPENSSGKNEQIEKLKDKLKSNGCTLTTLNTNKNKDSIKDSPTNSTSSKKNSDCQYCKLHFSNTKTLAKHQLCHLVLSSFKLHERKYLEKQNRRGRIITIDQKKCIRCLNCWKLFENNKTILDHWINGDCDFYCQICGEEFINNPKLLREHVQEIHKINYKFSKRPQICVKSPKLVVRDLFNKTTKPFILQSSECSLISKIKTEPNDTGFECSSSSASTSSLTSSTFENHKIRKQSKKKNSEISKAQCEICLEKFANYRSKNSHMRKHKKRVEIDKVITKNEENDKKLFSNGKKIKVTTMMNQVNYEISMEVAPSISSHSEDLHDTIKTEVKEEPYDDSYDEVLNSSSAQELQVSDLQDPLHSEQTKKQIALRTYSIRKLNDSQDSSQSDLPKYSEEKSEDDNDNDHMNYGNTLKCQGCGQVFIFKCDLFKHKKECELSNIFTCKFCLRSFITTADLQMHILLLHQRDISSPINK